ncbi:hypothetical protein OG756_37600 [Streptomyces sp. NBC_01310]|uniref:hypothetical protein n=1 Tax=Streptomyces sp. NBC_01310 TaxID=2903820 RepID=UPI0035B65CF4|nr:hypothetical protein OG756_37600 [Streptomyces sp. NBC_01310]
MTDTFARTPSTGTDSLDLSLTPMALPVVSAEERACSCIYCFKAKETFAAPPMRYIDDAAGSGH